MGNMVNLNYCDDYIRDIAIKQSGWSYLTLEK